MVWYGMVVWRSRHSRSLSLFFPLSFDSRVFCLLSYSGVYIGSGSSFSPFSFHRFQTRGVEQARKHLYIAYSVHLVQYHSSAQPADITALASTWVSF